MSISLGTAQFEVKFVGLQSELNELKRRTAKFELPKIKIFFDERSIEGQLRKLDTSLKRNATGSGAAWGQNFVRGIKLNETSIEFSRLVRESSRVGAASADSYSTAFSRNVRLSPNFTGMVGGSSSAGAASGRSFSGSFTGASRTGVGTGASIFGGLATGATTAGVNVGRLIANSILGTGRAIIGTGATIFSGLISGAVSIGTTAGRGVVSGISSAISAGTSSISNAC